MFVFLVVYLFINLRLVINYIFFGGWGLKGGGFNIEIYGKNLIISIFIEFLFVVLSVVR